MATILRNIIFLFGNFINRIIFKLNNVNYSNADLRGLILINNGGVFKLGENCVINSSKYKNIIGGDVRSSFVVKKGAKLSIGSNFRMSNSAIYCADSITIGNNVMIGGSTKIWDTDFHPLQSKTRTDTPNEGYKTKPIFIGDGVFIGGFSIILKGTSIGNNSIIGAGSVVSGNIPEAEIWAGNPAKFIRKVNQ